MPFGKRTYENSIVSGNLLGFNRLYNAALKCEGCNANEKKIKTISIPKHIRCTHDLKKICRAPL